jgi:hypothetical protein
MWISKIHISAGLLLKSHMPNITKSQMFYKRTLFVF